MRTVARCDGEVWFSEVLLCMGDVRSGSVRYCCAWVMFGEELFCIGKVVLCVVK